MLEKRLVANLDVASAGTTSMLKRQIEDQDEPTRLCLREAKAHELIALNFVAEIRLSARSVAD